MEVRRTALDDRNVSAVVVEAVADALGVSPFEIEPPLYRAIDPDALNDLFAQRSEGTEGTARVSFSYAGCDITVREQGEIVVQPGPESDREQTA